MSSPLPLLTPAADLRHLSVLRRSQIHSNPSIVAPRGLIETLFVGLGFLVLQGAFIGMAVSDVAGAAAGADESDPRHLIAFALVLLGTGVFALGQWRGIMQVARSNLPYFILPAVIVASTLWSVDPLLTMKRSLLTAGICFFDLYVVATLGLDRLLRVLSLTIFISAIASVLAAFAVPTIGREIGEGLVGDWRGVFPQKNAFGHVMSVGVFIEMSIMIRARRLLLGAALRAALCILLVVLANSQSSLLAVMLALVISIFYAASRRGAATLLVCAILSMATMILVGSVVATDPSAVFQLFDRDASLTGRTDLWAYVLDAIGEKPLAGWGYAAFWAPDSAAASYIQNQIRWDAPNAHNGYLELALSIGIIGLVALMATGLWTGRRIVMLGVRRHDLGALLLIISGQLLAINLTESFMISASVFGWNVFSLIALKSGVVLQDRSDGQEIPAAALQDQAPIA